MCNEMKCILTFSKMSIGVGQAPVREGFWDRYWGRGLRVLK